MQWNPAPAAPITHLTPTPSQPLTRIFEGKPHALAFLADESLVIGTSRGLTLHPPGALDPDAALIDVGGAVTWMRAHPDGESVVLAARSPSGCSASRVWPATQRVLRLVEAPTFGYAFGGALSPDGALLVWQERGEQPTLHTVDVHSGQRVRSVASPPETSGATNMVIRDDGVIYISSRKLWLVKPDGAHEQRQDEAFFHSPSPVFLMPDGGFIDSHGDVFKWDGAIFTRDYWLRLERDGVASYDRKLYATIGFGEARVTDLTTGQTTQAPRQRSASGSIPSWQGNGAAASARFLATIDYLDASVLLRPLDALETPIAALNRFSQGARRLMFHDDRLTIHTSQPPNTCDSIMEIELDGGASRMLSCSEVHDMARTRDGQRLLVMRSGYALNPRIVSQLDAAGEVVEELEVQRWEGGGLAMTPDERLWAVGSHSMPSNHRNPYTYSFQWRAFGAAKWAKNVKMKGTIGALALCDSAAALLVDEALQIVGLAKGKPLREVTLPRAARAPAISPDGAWVALPCYDALRLVEVATGAITEITPELPCAAHPSTVSFKDAQTLFVGYDSGAITQHAIPSGAQEALLLAHTDMVRALVWRDGSLWSGAEDGTILKWGQLG